MEINSGKNYNKLRIVDGFGRVTIPAEIRRKFGLKYGSSVVVEEQGGKIVVVPHKL